MIEKWEKLKIEKIVLAIYVPPKTGPNMHKDRPSHGLVLNDTDSVKDYVFSDGTTLRTNGGDLFYLPKGSTYSIKSIESGGCYAINFDADIDCEPFSVELKNNEKILRAFKDAAKVWKMRDAFYEMTIIKSVYDIVLQMAKEQQKKYIPKSQELLITPALERIKNDFTGNDLSVAELCSLCGISEAYFRRIFISKFGVSPKEYIINMRMNYAKQLLKSGQFSVGETANLCGYAEECHFSREFTKRVGVNPKKYRTEN